MKFFNKLFLILTLCSVMSISAQSLSDIAKSKKGTQKKFDPTKMTPEFLWTLGRVSEIQVSPDGQMVLFGISEYSLKENKGNRNLYLIPAQGGNIIKLTNSELSLF